MNCRGVVELLRKSLVLARSQPVANGPPIQVNHARSRAWVDAVALTFREYFAADLSVRVFTQTDPLNRADFGCNELLYDVTVARTATVLSHHQKKQLSYVSKVLWQVESEFARNARQALFDFNKLVLGSAEQKLFIGPYVYDPEAFLRTLLPAATSCSGQVYAALVSHPDRWYNSDPMMRVWSLGEARWDECEQEGWPAKLTVASEKAGQSAQPGAKAQPG